MTRVRFSLEKQPSTLLSQLPGILAIANGEKEALGFLPEGAYSDAITQRRLFTMIADDGSNSEVAGFILFGGVYPHARVQQIGVQNKFRREGIASALMNELISEMERNGFLTIKAAVASDLATAQAFYQRSGFEAVGSRRGGAARNRTIVTRVRELDTDNLFRNGPTNRPGELGPFELGVTRRSVGDSPFYAIDLNVLFDLVRDRARSEDARRLFGAALAHRIRLVVTPEFINELQRTTPSESSADPILQMALQLPRLPPTDTNELDRLAKEIHRIVFVEPNVSGAGSVQALSDARHLAHSALSRAAGYITSDRALLLARSKLLNSVGIDVASLDELLTLLPIENTSQLHPQIQGEGFECKHLSASDLMAYLRGAGVHTELINDSCTSLPFGSRVKRESICDNGLIVAVGSVIVPPGIDSVARLLIHSRSDHLSCELFTDYLLDTMVRFACTDAPVAIELLHIPGQTTSNSLAKARGFLRAKSGNNLIKVALGRPLTSKNWDMISRQVRRRTGLLLPEGAEQALPSGQVTVADANANVFKVTPNQLQELLSPTIIAWNGRDGVIVPIARSYAEDLLGTSDQFSLLESRDAAFLSRRAYVNSPRSASLMRPDMPIMFYESKRTGGRGAVVAVARIVDSVLIRKSEVPRDLSRRLVVDSVNEFSSSDDVLLTSFDNLLLLPRPCSLDHLKNINAVGVMNLQSATHLTSDNVGRILEFGWSRD